MTTTKPIFRAFAKTDLVPLEVIKALANYSFSDPVISLYLNLTPENVKRKAYISQVKSMIKQAKQKQEKYIKSLTKAQQQALKQDIEEIIDFIENEFNPDGLQTLVIFKSGRELKLALHLPVKLYSANRVVIDSDIYTLPLLALYHKNPKTLVVRIAKTQAKIYRLHLGIFEPITTLKTKTYPIASIPLKDKAQARMQAHTHRFFKEVVKYLVNLHIQEHFNKIIIAGVEATVQRFMPVIPEYMQKRIIGEIYLPAEATEGMLKQQAIDTLRNYLRAQEQHQLEIIKNLYNAGKLLYGVKAILEAQNMFLLRKLWIDSNAVVPGYVCPNDHYLALEPQQCPICNTQLIPADNILDELTELAINYHIDMFTFDILPGALADFDGVVGLTY